MDKTIILEKKEYEFLVKAMVFMKLKILET